MHWEQSRFISRAVGRSRLTGQSGRGNLGRSNTPSVEGGAPFAEESLRDINERNCTISTNTPSLRQRIIRGGVFLVGRSIFAGVIALINIVLITREIGPADYGVYITALGIVHYLSIVSRLGIDVYLIRREEEPVSDTYNQAFILLLPLSILIIALGHIILPLLETWLEDDRFVGPYRAMLLVLPAVALTSPALARLERELDYRSVAAIEVLGQMAFGIVAVTLAFRGAGVWAPVTGYIVWHTFRVLTAWTVAGLRPRLQWSPVLLGDMIRYGIAYSSSTWVWQLRSLVNPLVVGGALGPEAVALVGLAIKIAETLSFARRAAWRLALVAMARVQQDESRSSRLMNEAMFVQIMVLGPFLSGFALLGPWLLPLLYGPEWQRLFVIYPFVALGTLVNAVFNMHSSQLYVRKRNLDVTVFHLVHITLFAGTALLSVQQFGLIGYGYAEIIALCSYWVIHKQLLKFLRPSYGSTFLWLGAYIPPLFAPLVDPARVLLLWLPFLAVALLPRSRRQVRSYTAYILHRGSAQ
jgi:O-antigen/teichoic acid export membrane protein